MTIHLLDSSSPWQLFFQDSATPVMEGITNLHHDLMFFLTFILFFVSVLLARTLYYFSYNAHRMANPVIHGTVIEIV
jgi:cytochrome c oxidase subunit 2